MRHGQRTMKTDTLVIHVSLLSACQFCCCRMSRDRLFEYFIYFILSSESVDVIVDMMWIMIVCTVS